MNCWLSRSWKLPHTWLAAISAVALASPGLEAAQIGDVTETSAIEQAITFLTLGDRAVVFALLGAIFLGISCGLLGGFIVVRRMALFGDALSHAVLPGVAIGFLFAETKDPLAIFVGATIAGLLGVFLVNCIRDTTHLKEDAALGMILAGFYGVGTVIVRMIQNQPTGEQAGLTKYFFGQISALSSADVVLMGLVALGSILLVLTFYKELVVISFDRGFARATGIPDQIVHYLLMLMLAFAVVAALQAVGIVLVSALLITPAATAYLLTDRMDRLLIISAAVGVASGIAGAFISYLGTSLPTGPFIVLSATFIFLAALVLSPRHGLLIRFMRSRRRRNKVQIENTLKAIYHIIERTKGNEPFERGDGSGLLLREVSLRDLSWQRNTDLQQILAEARMLVRGDLATFVKEADNHATPVFDEDRKLLLTRQGWERACEVVRNHRLWELFLTNEANYTADHVHDDAEVIEHLLGPDTVRQLEKRLDFPNRDPHGKLIPSLADIGGGVSRREAQLEPPDVPGYRRN